MKRFRSAKSTSWLGAVAVALIVGGGLLSYRRGTAVAPPAQPASAADGVRCGLVTPRRVRCVGVTNAPSDQVFRRVTDYARFPELMRSTFFELELSSHVELEEDRFRLVGAVSGLTRRWPFEVEVAYEHSPERSKAVWHQLSGVLSVDRGSWAIEPLSEKTSLVTYEIEVAQPGVPQFIVSDVLLDNLPGGLEHVLEVAAQGAR